MQNNILNFYGLAFIMSLKIAFMWMVSEFIGTICALVDLGLLLLLLFQEVQHVG